MPVRKTVGMDKFPNFISGRLTLSAANTFTNQQVFTPIPRLKTSGNKATVMELLWVDLQLNVTDFVAAGDNAAFSMSIGTAPTTVTSRLDDPRTITSFFQEASAAATMVNMDHRIELQSLDGYGTLLASDSFNVSGVTTGQAAAVQYDFRLYYRFVEISIAEFVGLVQSTQAS